MESLNNTDWDVVIAGTGLHQSLLSLALSRSGKKILHLDKNGYYGGAEAALSLQEADEWANGVATSKAFQNAQISRPTENEDGPKLSFSRAYSLALGPQLIYTESIFLKYLVTSKVYRQLDFLALGSWWLLTSAVPEGETSDPRPHQKLVRIPSSREELVFSDDFVDIRSKRSVMKVLRFIAEYDDQIEVWEPFRSRQFKDFLIEQFSLPPATVDLFLALVLSTSTSEEISTEYALPRIARHLRSIGRLGPGFSSVIPKWGGLSEVAQVACRAGAVGGSVYVLGRDIEKIQSQSSDQECQFELALAKDDVVRAKKIVGSLDDLPKGLASEPDKRGSSAARSISVVSSPLTPLFPTLTEGAPPPAGSMVILPAESLLCQGCANSGAIYLVIHSADTGECPQGQSVIYASTLCHGPRDRELLALAVESLLYQVDSDESASKVLWNMFYEQLGVPEPGEAVKDGLFSFPPSSLDLAFDDGVMETVRDAWRFVLGDEAKDEDFLCFPDREGEESEEDAV